MAKRENKNTRKRTHNPNISSSILRGISNRFHSESQLDITKYKYVSNTSRIMNLAF